LGQNERRFPGEISGDAATSRVGGVDGKSVVASAVKQMAVAL
jgi:hypothetical protein